MHKWRCWNGATEVDNNQKSPISYLLVSLFQITFWSKLCSIIKWFHFNNFSISSAAMPTAAMLPPSYNTLSSFSEATSTHLAFKIYLLQQCLSYSEACPTPFRTAFYRISNWHCDKWVWLYTLCCYLKVGTETTIPYKALQRVPLGP